MNTSPPALTDTEVDEICDGMVQNAAKVRYLRSLGLNVHRKPNGRPLVSRRHYDEVMCGAAPARKLGGKEPNWTKNAR